MYQSIHPGAHVTRVRNIPPAPTRIDVAAFIGIAERGPVDHVEVIEGWPQFVKTYGDFCENAFLAYTVRGFFDNGGLRCHILRVVAPALETETDGVQPADRASSNLADTGRVRAGAVATLVQSSSTTTQGVQPMDRKSTVVASVAGMAAGNVAMLQQPGVYPARREIVAVNPISKTLLWSEPVPTSFDLDQQFTITSTVRDERIVATVADATITWTRPLDDRFDLEKKIHVGFGAAVASAMLYDETGDPLLAIEANNAGRWGNRLSVQVMTRFSGDYFTRQRTLPDTNHKLSVDRIDGLQPASFVEISQNGSTTHRTILISIDTTNVQVELATPLVGFDLRGAADGSKPILLRHVTATLSVFEASRLIETHKDIDLPLLSESSVSQVNLRSHTIRIARLPSSTQRWLDPASPLLDGGRAQLSGGRDGIAMLRATDFTGVSGQQASGIALFESREEPAAIALPDIMLPPLPALDIVYEDPISPNPCTLCPGTVRMLTLQPPDVLIEASPAFSLETIEWIQRTLVEHCEARGDRVALLDVPATTSGECMDWPVLMRWRQRFDSSYAATYYPWIDVADPLDRTGRLVRRIPPAGHALGQFALADRDSGRDAPANRQLHWTAATACAIDDAQHAMLNERGINAITIRPGRGIRIMGARTLSSHPDWKQVTVRRLFIRLKRAFRRELAWAVFEPVNRFFEQRVIATLESLLELEWQAGRLRGTRSEEAFQVVVEHDAVNNDNGEFVVLVAIAPSLPAEFVFLQLSFTLDAMDIAELTAAGGWPS